MSSVVIKVMETRTKEKFELKLTTRKGRLTLNGAGSSAVVFGCGCKKENMLSDLNRCSVSRKNKLNFVEA